MADVFVKPLFVVTRGTVLAQGNVQGGNSPQSTCSSGSAYSWYSSFLFPLSSSFSSFLLHLLPSFLLLSSPRLPSFDSVPVTP